MIDLSLQENKIAKIIFNMTEFPMNVWNGRSIEAFDKILDQISATPGIRGILLTSARKEFIAGADLKSLLPLHEIERNMKVIRHLNKSFRKLETLKIPSVSIINGAALGGGYELCLASHYRIALNHETVKIGLPEVTLGLLPGGGGTQRLPRLIGMQDALMIMVDGTAGALQAGVMARFGEAERERLGRLAGEDGRHLGEIF